MKDIHFIGGACALAGLVIGFAGGTIWADKKLSKEYAAASAAMRQAYEMAVNVEPSEPVSSEEELTFAGLKSSIPSDPDTFSTKVNDDGFGQPVVFDMATPHTPGTGANPYHTAVAAVETSSELFVSGGINDYGISYLEAEEFEDEGDGFQKFNVSFVMDGINHQFFLDGVQMDDWDERLGDSIVVDFMKFFQIAPAGTPPVLYVRNHKRVEDYEVIAESP